jgi:hypothetical protein
MSKHSLPDPASGAQADPFSDLGKLRLSQDFAANLGVKKLLTTVPVRKPTGQEFVRVHPDEAYRLQTAVLELKDERETYLVAPELWGELPGELKPVALFTAVNRQGVVFLWPVKLPGEDGRVDEWNRSALEAADHAATRWVRVKANMSLGAYELFEATGDLPDPQWPDSDFTTLLRTAFKVRYIDSIEHPVIRRLRGEA